MAMNIKNEETVELARELATLTGESMTSAVTVAIRERLDRVRSAPERRVEHVLRLGREIAERLPEPHRSVDHGDLLYDDVDLPARSSTPRP
jgi:antitoxin VapB